MLKKIVTISGGSAVGKSKLERDLMAHFGGSGRVRTITTRAPRADETIESYDFQTPKGLRAYTDLLWIIEAHHNKYSVRRQAFYDAATESGVSFVSITPDCHEKVRSAFENEPVEVIGIHLLSPAPDELRRRMQMRHPTPSEAEIEKRLEDSRVFDQIASSVPGLISIENGTNEGVLKHTLEIVYGCR